MTLCMTSTQRPRRNLLKTNGRRFGKGARKSLKTNRLTPYDNRMTTGVSRVVPPRSGLDYV